MVGGAVERGGLWDAVGCGTWWAVGCGTRWAVGRGGLGHWVGGVLGALAGLGQA